MGKDKKKPTRMHFSSPPSEQAISKPSNNVGNGYDGGTNAEPNGSETISVRISCTPHGSKLKKPTDFFKLALADITKPHSNEVRIKSVSYLKDDIFLVEIYKTCLNVIENLASRDDLVFATKNIKIMDYNPKTKRRYEKYNGLNTSEGRVVEILGDTYGLGDSCQKFFERNGGLHSYDIESVNMSSTPQTITFCSAQGARRFVQRRTLNIYGKRVYFRLRGDDLGGMHNDSESDAKIINKRTVVLYGDIKSIGQSILELYFENRKRSGGGDLERIDVSTDPPVAIFCDAEGAERVISKFLHKVDGKHFYAMRPKQKEDNKEENDKSVSGVEHGKMVEIHGDIEGLSKDSLVVYLESTRRSGGGFIDEIDLLANPPRIVFADSEAAMRVVGKGVHSYHGKEFHLKFPAEREEREEIDISPSNISKKVPGNIVEIYGDINGLRKESLQMYLENTKRSGGGEIEEVNFDVSPPRVIFRDAEAARRVVVNGVHTFGGKEFLLVFPLQKNEREGKDDKSSKLSKVEPGNIVEIHGDIKGLGKDSLEMYLENAKRSGGGKIEKVNLDATPPRVIFRDTEAARRVVENKVHTFDGKEFLFKFPVQKNESLGEDSESSRTANAEPRNIVEIHGDIKGLGKDSLELYLENTGRSGGGEIEKINLDATPPRVIFRDAKAAARVSSKESHRIDGISFQLKKPKVTVLREDTIMLRNLEPSTSKELLSMYLERLCGSVPHSIETNHDKSMVMASCRHKLDWNRIKLEYSKRSTLSGSEIAFEQVPVCNGAFASNIPDTVSTDYLRLVIEKHCGSDSVEDLDYDKGKEYAFITFRNPKALLTLTKQEIKFEGKTVHIEEYHPSFITERIWKTMHKEPAEICINVDGLIMEHMMNKHKMDMCRRLKSEVYTKNIKSSEGHITGQACFSRCADVPNQTEVFHSFYDEFISKEASADINDQGVRDLAVSLDVTIHSKTDGVLAVIGKKHDVEKFLESVDKSSQIQTDIELPPEKIRLLRSVGYLKDLEKELHVKIETDQEKLTAIGNELQVSRVETKLTLKLQNIKTSSLQVTDAMCKLLKDQRTYNEISDLMQNHMIHLTLDELNKAIIFLAMSQEALRKGMDEFRKIVGEVKLPLNENQASFLNGHRGSQVLKALSSSSKHVVVDKSNKFIKLTGLVDNCRALEREILRLLEENSFLKRLLPLSTGKTKAVLTIFKGHIDTLLEKHRDSQVSVDMSKDKCSIEVTGYGKAVSDVLSQLKDSCKRIYKEELVFQRPGLSKVIALESFRHMIDGLEKEKKVIIIRKAEDKEGIMPREEIEEEYDIIPDLHSSRLICRYQTTNGLQLLVFQGDITRHKADAIVNPANTSLSLLDGVAGAIKSAGGSVIQDECKRHIRVRGSVVEGEVVITSAGRLPCRKVIHAVGPMWPNNTRRIGEQELLQNRNISKETLAEVMKNLLVEAEKEECRVVAVPAISSGVFGFPKDLCAKILVKTALDISKQGFFHSLKEVHFVNNDVPTVQVFNDEFYSSFHMKPGFQSVRGIQDSKKSSIATVKVRPDNSVKEKVPQGKHQSSFGAKLQPDSSGGMVSANNGIQLELVIGDLAKVTADIIVNSTSQDLNLSRNPCARELSKAAGKNLQEECSAWVASHGTVPKYSFADTKGGNLQCKKVLHAVCGQYTGKDSENGLETLVTKLLEKATTEGSNTIAIPALGTGILQFPRDTVAKIMVDCVRKFNKTTKIRKVFLVACHLDAPMIAAFKDALENTESAGTRKNSIRKAPSSSPLDEDDMVYTLGNVVLEIKCGDITKESTDAIVVLGNQHINLLGAVGTAIKDAEGAGFLDKIDSKRPQKEGTTVLLQTVNLPSRYIAHIYPKSESYDDLKAATKEMFRRCDSKNLESLSLPAIGTGVMGKAPEESAKLILHSFVELSVYEKVSNIKQLSIVLFEEGLVSSFKKKMKEILLNPEEPWDKSKENTGILAWIKEKFAIFKSYLVTGSDKDRANGLSNDVEAVSSSSVLSSLALNLYFSCEKRVVREVREKITKLLEDHINSFELTKEMYKALPSYHLNKIKSFAKKHDVFVELDANAGKLKLSGFHRDIADVANYCHTMSEHSVVEDQKREKEQTVAKYVQWKEKQKDGSVCDYDPVLNCQIETYFSNEETGARVEIDEGGDTSTFELDFSNKENMTIKNIKTGEIKALIREELGGAVSKEDLPGHWDQMPKDSSGFEVKVHCVVLY